MWVEFRGQTETPDSPDGSSGVFPVPLVSWTEVRVPFGRFTIHPFSPPVNTFSDQFRGNSNEKSTLQMQGAFLCATVRLITLLYRSHTAREEGVSHDLGGLSSCECVGRSEVWPVLAVTRLAWAAARIAVHSSRPVDEQPLYEQVEC